MSEKRFYVETVAVRDKVITDKDKFYSYEDLDEIVDVLNEQQNQIHRDELSIKTMLTNMEKLEKENEQLQKKLMIASAHLLSDECNLTESQIKNIIKEMENV